MNLLKSSTLVILVSFLVLSNAHTASAATLTQAQRAHIDRTLAEQGLNPYGDPKGTMYMGGNPLFDEGTGRTIDRYDYVLRKLPRILDGFVTTLPFDGVPAVLAAKAPGVGDIRNDFDPNRLSDRFIDSALRAEEEAQATVESIRSALEARDFKAVYEVLNKLASLPRLQLLPMSSVLKDARRMLNGEVIQDAAVTAQVRSLLAQLDAIEAKL